VVRRAARLHDFNIVELRPDETRGAPRPQPRALAATIQAGVAPQQTAHAGLEALVALHAAVFREQPMTTKRVHVYGEVSPDVKVVEAPIGTLAADLLEICGVDLRLYAIRSSSRAGRSAASPSRGPWAPCRSSP
jgi:hypothetical protein